jgi:DNA-binding transcriptional MerR regulator
MSRIAVPKNKWSISELAKEFDLSTRTIRFYEEKGLLSPERTAGGHRYYTRRDRARLRLILRGKRFGHSLEEIADMIGPASAELCETEQIRKSLAYGDRNLAEICRRMEELKLMEREILDLREKLTERLKELEA